MNNRLLTSMVSSLLLLGASACTQGIEYLSGYFDNSIAETNIELGDNKYKVLKILGPPTQKGLPQGAKKNPDKYMRGNDLIEIYYLRTGRQSDNLTTDDEFTPYLFKNGNLVSIGWQALGGPKTVGEALQPTPKIRNSGSRSSGSRMSLMCKTAIAEGDPGAIEILC